MPDIFLVEDNPLISHLYRTKFTSEGFGVELAEDGLKAIKLLATAKPDLMVLDLMLPILSGVDVLKYIRARPD
jgi:DNA-binding response OmpR family regulator